MPIYCRSLLSWVTVLGTILGLGTEIAAHSSDDFAPCTPASEIVAPDEGAPDLGFCSEWNPDFGFKGSRCCAKPSAPRRRRRERCSPKRIKYSYCDEMTPEQIRYGRDASAGKLGDLLAHITVELGRQGGQAFCGVNHGFLAYGRRLIPSPQNRLMIRSPERCLDFGTDEMTGMLEWVGRQVALKYTLTEYPGSYVRVGAVSAPRGGCISGRGGRRAHASHTSGQDADIGFFNVKKGAAVAERFSRDFNPESNWWFLKQVFQNPFACVKAVFLDKKLIRKIHKEAQGDPKWNEVRPYIQHLKGHKNHFHIRVGNKAGDPGCTPDVENEAEMDSDSEEDDQSEEGGAVQ
jgi:murein endopeptidase